jgi:hypothetical protein
MVDGLQLFHQILVFLVFIFGPVVVVVVEVEIPTPQLLMVPRQMDYQAHQFHKYVAMVVVPDLTFQSLLRAIGV